MQPARQRRAAAGPASRSPLVCLLSYFSSFNVPTLARRLLETWSPPPLFLVGQAMYSRARALCALSCLSPFSSGLSCLLSPLSSLLSPDFSLLSSLFPLSLLSSLSFFSLAPQASYSGATRQQSMKQRTHVLPEHVPDLKIHGSSRAALV